MKLTRAPSKDSPSSRRLLVLLGLIVAGMLYAGLSTRDFQFRNDVEWSPDGRGIDFSGRGLAYTDRLLSATQFSRDRGLTIEIALKGLSRAPNFQFIAVFDDGADDTQLLIGQWQKSIIVMNGHDYSNRQKLPRAAVDLSSEEDGPIHLAIASKSSGTTIHLNGERRTHRADLELSMPGRSAPARLILGNSAGGTRPMTGELRGVAVYPKALDADTIRRHSAICRSGGSFTEFAPEQPHLLYALSEGRGRKSLNHAAYPADLLFPLETSFLDGEAFTSDLPEGPLKKSFVWDVAVNLLGFIPLGALLTTFFLRCLRTGWAITASAMLGLVLSFVIEWAQTFVPSRTSSLLDLFLNTAGALLGALLVIWIRAKERKTSKTLSTPES